MVLRGRGSAPLLPRAPSERPNPSLNALSTLGGRYCCFWYLWKITTTTTTTKIQRRVGDSPPPSTPHPPRSQILMGERMTNAVSCERWQKQKQMAQGQNKTTCLPSSNVVLGVHRESLGGEKGATIRTWRCLRANMLSCIVPAQIFFRFFHLSQLTAFFVRSLQGIWLRGGCGVEGGGESPTLRWIFVVVIVIFHRYQKQQ